jgi:subtilisin family serine protease
MIANSSSEVNARRSGQCSALAVTSDELLRLPGPADCARAVTAEAPALEVPNPLKLQKIPDDVSVNVFIETVDPAEELEFEESVEGATTADPEDVGRTRHGVSARRGSLATACVRLSQLKEVADRLGVTFIEAGQELAEPKPIVSSDVNVLPSASPRRVGDPAEHGDGARVLIGIIDVQGFDFAHRDFLDEANRTRFIRIWDQGGSTRPNPHARAAAEGKGNVFGREFDYGSEIRQSEMNAAIEGTEAAGAGPQDLEPQSQMLPRSHGTHVASIAAGNNGICRKAPIAAVLIDLPKTDMDRRRSFYDSTRIVHAVDYLFTLGKELQCGVSINISLGTNGHAHDASSAVSRWLDSTLSMPGRSICVAAGNSGQQEAESPGDLGWVMGRIHTSGQLSAAGLSADIEWEVVGDGRVDLSENEFEIWYAAQDRFSVQIRPPGLPWIGPIEPGQYLENHIVRDGREAFQCVLSIYNELYHPANGSNYMAIYLTPFLSDPITGVAAGRWVVRLNGLDVRDGRFHGWIERDDPRRLGALGGREAWWFPSYFSERSNSDKMSVSSLACGQRVISVANLDDARERIHITSSQGPTRDNRFKPDVRASPYVAGVAGLMLAVEPRLTAAQIEAIVHRTARPLPGVNYTWLNDAGFGRINPEGCLREARTAYVRTPYVRKEVEL